MWTLILEWSLVAVIGIAFAGSIWYFYKNIPVVPNGSSALHYHMVSAHVNYKHKKEIE